MIRLLITDYRSPKLFRRSNPGGGDRRNVDGNRLVSTREYRFQLRFDQVLGIRQPDYEIRAHAYGKTEGLYGVATAGGCQLR